MRLSGMIEYCSSKSRVQAIDCVWPGTFGNLDDQVDLISSVNPALCIWQLVKWQTHEIVGHYCRFIFIGKQSSSLQMKNNPESDEFCCLHICLFNNNGKAIQFLDDLGAPASSFSLVTALYCYGRPPLQAWLPPDLNTIPNNRVRENPL